MNSIVFVGTRFIVPRMLENLAEQNLDVNSVSSCRRKSEKGIHRTWIKVTTTPMIFTWIGN